MSIFCQKFDFRPRFWFSTKISIFDQNFDFRPKFWSAVKISIVGQNFDFRPKFWSSTKISICRQNFDFRSNFRFSTTIFYFLNPKLELFIKYSSVKRTNLFKINFFVGKKLWNVSEFTIVLVVFFRKFDFENFDSGPKIWQNRVMRKKGSIKTLKYNMEKILIKKKVV